MRSSGRRPLAPPQATEALSSPGHALGNAAIVALGPTLAPLTRAARPSSVPVIPRRMRVGVSGDNEERQAQRAADAATTRPPATAHGDGTRGELAPAERRRLESIRVHTGPQAARSAALLGAEAYAIPGHIVFGDSRYDPASLGGRHLIAHELTHALEPPVATPVLRRQPKPTPPPPLQYDTGTQTFNPPPAGTTMVEIDADKAAKQASGDLGQNASVSGIHAGAPDEVYVWNALLQRADKSNWGTELDTITAIGPAPQSGGAAPVGRVTIQIDAAGNATATLLAGGPLAAGTTLPDDATARAKLTKDFGFSNVTDGSAKWALTELNKVYDALSRLPSADRVALAGVELRRESTVINPATGKQLAGRFSHTEGVTGTNSTTVVDTRELLIADRAFSEDAASFIGGKTMAAPMSFQTILHESGHAVEEKPVLDAKHAENAALAASNQEAVDITAAVGVANTESKKATATFNAYGAAQQKASRSYIEALQAVMPAIDTFAHDASSTAHPPSEKPASAAIARRDKQKAALPAGNPALSDFAAFSSAQDKWFAEAQKRAAAQSNLKAAKAATAAVSATVGGASESKRLKAFNDFVTANKIKPLTTYAATSPAEFFAEAYGLWLNDPDYLGSQLPALKAWFDQGTYRV
jgi:hypothetical protein